MTDAAASYATRGREANSMREGGRRASNALGPLILIVEDDRRMRRYLKTVLADQGYRVLEAETGQDALVHAAGHNPELILLDFALPDMDALQVTTRLREWTLAPIVIVSVCDRENEKVAALDAGANDYLTKPFHTGELLARIRVWLRETQRAGPDSLESAVEIGELKIDFAKRLVFVAGEEVRLTATEYKLFAVLMRNAGRVLTHEQLLADVWGPAYLKEMQYLRVYMGQLRQKLEKNPARPRYLVTESGVGYRIRTT